MSNPAPPTDMDTVEVIMQALREPASPARATVAGKALVVGASGTAGSYIGAALRGQSAWDVVELGRRSGNIRADLLDRQALVQALGPAADVTHAFFVARLAAPTLEREIEDNVAALTHLLDALQEVRSPLKRLVLMEGTKWYGSHLGSYPVPAVESGRSPTPYYYHAQQDALAQRAADGGFAWTALRPHTVLGYTQKPEHNFLLLLAMYAALQAAHGGPLHFPGSTGRWTLPTVATNAELLGAAALWAATADAAAGEAFNVNNGDVLSWPSVWASIAVFFGVEPAGPSHTRLAEAMPARHEEWKQLVERHGLVDMPWPDARCWAYADGICMPERADIIPTQKITSAGFAGRADTRQSIIDIFSRFRRERLIP